MSLSNTQNHFGHATAALTAIEPAMASAYALFEAERPHLLLTAVERCYGDALAQGNRPREATLVLRQVVADQRALDVEETTRVRTAMSQLARAHYFRGAFADAASLYGETAAMHDRLTGGANLEGIACWCWVALTSAMAGHLPAAVAALSRSDVLLDVPPDTDAVYFAHPLVTRALVELRDGRPGDALATLERFPRWAGRVAGHLRVRAERVRSAALLAAGRPHDAVDAARTALEALPADNVALEEGLLALALARAARAIGDSASADAAVHRATRVWDAHQVDDAALREAAVAEFEGPRGGG